MAYQRRLLGALLGSVSFLALSLPAAADAPPAPQAAEPGAAATKTDDKKIERVVVTASKRSESVRDVPMGITALTGSELERQRATGFSDYVDLVPGMTYTAGDPGHTSLVLRGVNTGGVAATLATYLDETPYGSSSALANGTNKALNLDTFDIQRIEVLKGPQGTLYGANTLGGLLKFITNKPDPTEFDHKFEFGGDTVEDGDTGGFVKGMINVPLGSDVAIRAVGYYDNSPGFIDDSSQHTSNINDTESLGGRVALLYQPSENFQILLSAVSQNLDSGAAPVVDVVLGPGNSITPAWGDLEQRRVGSEFSDVRYRVYNATVNWDLAWADLVSSTSWAEHDESSRQDGTGVFGVFIDSSLPINKFTQEVRLVSPDSDSAFEWLVGGYFTHERAALHQDLVGTGLFLELTSKFIEKAVFANATYHFSEAFDISAGGRYSSNDQSARQFGLAAASGDSSENVFTWSVAPRLHLDEDTMLYARVAKGYRPGGPNALPPPPIPAGVPFTFEADTAINYEVGIKTDLLDGRLQLDADLFFIEWSNIQLLVFIPGFGGVNGNGETAETKGFEGSAAWAVTDNLTLRATIAYVDAYLTADTDPVTIGALSGDPLPSIPDWSGSLSAEYRFPTDGTFQPWLGGTWRHVGDRWSGFDTGIGQIQLDGYDALDLRAGVDLGMWTIQLYAKNVTDERGIIDLASQNFSVVSGTSTATVITPRTIGLAVTGRF